MAANAAGQVTIGQLPPGDPEAICRGGREVIPTGPASALYTVPSAGTITSWSTKAVAGGGQTWTMKVYRPVGMSFGAFQYTVVGHSGPETLTPATLNRFKAAIPVQAGDVIGLNELGPVTLRTACVFETTDPADSIAAVLGPDAADGSSVIAQSDGTSMRVNLVATLLTAPKISAVTPATSTVRGGTSVTISGANFDEVSGISFGGSPAASFRIDSESQITAVAPPSGGLGETSIALTTPAGTATASFVYTGCRVPRLTKKRLKAAKKLLAAAGCRIGKVKKLAGATARAGRVVRQSPRPTTVVAPGATVAVTLR